MSSSRASPPLFGAPILFGMGALALYLREYGGAWYSSVYYLLHALMTVLLFYGLHRAFSACRKVGPFRAVSAGIPALLSLSVYHFAIAFFDYFVVQIEDFFPF